MYDCFTYTSVCAHINIWFLRKPKEGSDNTELELQRTISHFVGTRASEVLNQLYNLQVYQVHHWKYLLRGWIKSSAVESIGCSCRVSGFNSQHKHNSSKQFVTPIWGPDALFCSRHCVYSWCAWICSSKIITHLELTQKILCELLIYIF